MFSFGSLRNRKKTASPTVAADATLLSADAVRSDGESLLDDDFAHRIRTSTTSLEMTNTFVLKSGTAPVDSESDFADWEHLTSADATPPDPVAESKHEENKQVVQEIVSALVEDAILLADQKRQQEEAALQEEQNQRLEVAAKAAADMALVFAKQQLQAETEQKQEPLLVSPPVLPVPVMNRDDYLSVKPPIPYSTVLCMQAFQTNRGPEHERIKRESGLYQQHTVANMKAGIQAARQNTSGANGVFSVGQSPHSSVTGFFQCFLGMPLLTKAAGLLLSDGEDSAENTQNCDAAEDAATLAMLTYGH